MTRGLEHRCSFAELHVRLTASVIRMMGYGSMMEKYRILWDARPREELLSDRSRPQPEIIILHGESRSGKSRWAFENFPNAYRVPVPEGGRMWVDGLGSEHKAMIFEDYRSWWTFGGLLRLCDRYPLTMQTKGGFMKIPDIETIIFTSNQDPRTWYNSYEKFGGINNPFLKRVAEKGRIEYYNAEGPSGLAYEVRGPVSSIFRF